MAEHHARFFIPKTAADRLASTYEALSSTTWGELRRMATPDLLHEVMDLLGLEEEPGDDSHFDLYDIGAVNDGDWPDWPEQLMLSWIPREILSEYGNCDSSVLNGPFGVLDSEREQEIIAAFGRLGYSSVRDDELITRCSGQ